MKKIIMALTVLSLHANAQVMRNHARFCEGTSRLNNITVQLDYNVLADVPLTLQNKGNTDAYRIAPLAIKAIDKESGSINGVTFISGTFNDVRRVNVKCGTYDLIFGPAAAVLLMKNDDGTIHDFFRLDCSH